MQEGSRDPPFCSKYLSRLERQAGKKNGMGGRHQAQSKGSSTP